MEPGLVSTIIPVYNRPLLLRDAVRSVLAQTYRPIEIIVVDDGSGDESRLAAERLSVEHAGEVVLILKEHGGVSAARNAGLERARGTDVTEGTAPFEYLRDTRTSKPVLGTPIAPLHVRSRVDDSRIAGWLRNGCQSQAVIGRAGTMIVFDDNVIHRGTLARGRHRDVLVFQVRPATFRAEPHLDRRWTGSFQHVDVNGDPYDITPHVK